MTTTTMTSTPPAAARRKGRLVRHWPIPRHWPIALAIGFAVLMWGAEPAGLAEVLMLLPLVYLVTAAAGRRSASWTALVVCLAALVALRAQDQVEVTTGVFVVAAVVLVGGLLHRGGRQAVLVQGAGLAVFGGIALLALDSGAETARLAVAAGWFAHGLWDLAHLRSRAVVSRSYAEWCAVLDMLIALQLLLTI